MILREVLISFFKRTLSIGLIALMLVCPTLVQAVDRKMLDQQKLNKQLLKEIHIHSIEPEIPKSMSLPKGFPKGKDNQLVCKSCHGMDVEKIPLEKIDKNHKDFFRGGPYTDLETFCSGCHQDKDRTRPNIHIMLDKDQKLIKKSCLYCHVEAPDPAKHKSDTVMKFQLPFQKLCLGCHLASPHLNAANHRVKPDDEMLKRMVEAEKKHGLRLPLDDQKRIGCQTCHSAHEKGVLKQGSKSALQVADTSVKLGITYEKSDWNQVVALDKQTRLEALSKKAKKPLKIEYQRIKHEILLRLPAKNGELCFACHRFKD